jgi:hypothetical protein
MSRLTTGILGAIGLSLVSGAAQFALGHDVGRQSLQSGQSLAPWQQQQRGPSQAFQTTVGEVGSARVNRGAKADRVTNASGLGTRTKTVSLRLEGFSDTSFLLRVPVADGGPTAGPAESRLRKPVVACEPVVSVLTEVARQLQPGRCVT